MTRWLLISVLLLPFLSFTRAAEPTTAFEVPYRLTETNHVLVRVKLNGTGPYNFILDTGAPSVFIPKVIAEQAKLNPDPRGWGDFVSFEIEGGLKIGKTKTRVEDLFQLQGMNGLGLAGVELHGVIGYNVLARYRITYDFTKDKLVFVPLNYQPPPVRAIGKGGQGGLEILGPVMKTIAGIMGVTPNFDIQSRGYLGIEVDEKPDGGVAIVSILPESPAAAAGLKTGDRITAVEDDVVKDYAALARLLAKKLAGETITLSITRDGQNRTVTAKLGEGL